MGWLERLVGIWTPEAFHYGHLLARGRRRDVFVRSPIRGFELEAACRLGAAVCARRSEGAGDRGRMAFFVLL